MSQEFRERLIEAALNGLTANPFLVQTALQAKRIDGANPSKILGVLAVEIADHALTASQGGSHE